MIVTHMSASDYVTQPWKNGGGSTTQLAVGHRRDRQDQWTWRASIADVSTSGPFSHFANIDRIIMLVQGRGMDLSFDAAPAHRIDQLHVPFAFDGGWKADCRLLDGPVRDFNLMIDRRFGRGAMQAIPMRDVSMSLPLGGACDLLHCLDGCVEATVATHSITVGKDETLRIDEGDGHVLQLQPRAETTTLVHINVRPL